MSVWYSGCCMVDEWHSLSSTLQMGVILYITCVSISKFAPIIMNNDECIVYHPTMHNLHTAFRRGVASVVLRSFSQPSTTWEPILESAFWYSSPPECDFSILGWSGCRMANAWHSLHLHPRWITLCWHLHFTWVTFSASKFSVSDILYITFRHPLHLYSTFSKSIFDILYIYILDEWHSLHYISVHF